MYKNKYTFMSKHVVAIPYIEDWIGLAWIFRCAAAQTQAGVNDHDECGADEAVEPVPLFSEDLEGPRCSSEETGVLSMMAAAEGPETPNQQALNAAKEAHANADHVLHVRPADGDGTHQHETPGENCLAAPEASLASSRPVALWIGNELKQ